MRTSTKIVGNGIGYGVEMSKYVNKYHSDALDILGSKCIKCGFTDKRALQIDHVNGGGTKQHRELGNWRVYKMIRDVPGFKDEFQILCANCNWIKKSENLEVVKKRNAL